MPSPRSVDAHTKAFSALRHLGFRESEVKAVLAELRANVALADATVERLLREALRRIQAPLEVRAPDVLRIIKAAVVRRLAYVPTTSVLQAA